MIGTRGRNAGQRGRRGWAALVVVAAAIVVVAAAMPATATAKPARAGTMTVDAGAAYTTTTSVTVNSVVSQATTMRIVNPDGTWSAWMPYATVTAWTVASGDGSKTVQAQYRTAGGRTVSLSDAITLDATAPVTTTDYDGVPAAVATVRLTATDALSGVAATSWRVDGGAWHLGATVTLALDVPHKRLGLTAGPHTVEFFSTDVAGNVASIQSVVVTLGA